VFADNEAIVWVQLTIGWFLWHIFSIDKVPLLPSLSILWISTNVCILVVCISTTMFNLSSEDVSMLTLEIRSFPRPHLIPSGCSWSDNDILLIKLKEVVSPLHVVDALVHIVISPHLCFVVSVYSKTIHSDMMSTMSCNNSSH